MDHGLNLWNVHLEPYASEAEFDKVYQTKYLTLIEQTKRFFTGHDPAECMVCSADALRGLPSPLGGCRAHAHRPTPSRPSRVMHRSCL